MTKTRKCLVFALGFAAAAAFVSGQEPDRWWKDYGGGPDNTHFFPGKQITKKNVTKLALAWNYPYATAGSSPVIANNVMYVEGRAGSLVALDATTGKEIWIHDGLNGMEGRGINYWESKDGKDRRILISINNYLQEVDANSGKSITTFGKDGVVDEREGLGRDVKTIAR